MLFLLNLDFGQISSSESIGLVGLWFFVTLKFENLYVRRSKIVLIFYFPLTIWSFLPLVVYFILRARRKFIFSHVMLVFEAGKLLRVENDGFYDRKSLFFFGIIIQSRVRYCDKLILKDSNHF